MTYSRTNSGTRISRQLSVIEPRAEQAPQRDRWLRIETRDTVMPCACGQRQQLRRQFLATRGARSAGFVRMHDRRPRARCLSSCFAIHVARFARQTPAPRASIPSAAASRAASHRPGRAGCNAAPSGDARTPCRAFATASGGAGSGVHQSVTNADCMESTLIDTASLKLQRHELRRAGRPRPRRHLRRLPAAAAVQRDRRGAIRR